MKTPNRMSEKDFRKSAKLASTYRDGCPICQGPVKYKLTSVSVHLKGWGKCTGYGQVLKVPIPWCPVCETEPADQGCVHARGGQMAFILPL